MQDGRPRLLVVDDEPGLATSVSDLAEELGFNSFATDNPETFKELYDRDFDVLILDLMMPQVDGIELIRFLSESRCRSSIILISGSDNQILQAAAELARAQGLQVVGSLRKPLRLADLEGFLQQAQSRTGDELREQTTGPTYEELKEAIEQKALTVFYQPKISLSESRVVGLEALARWIHPEKGFISPAVFIPLAEETGLIDPLTEFVVYAALESSVAWVNAGLIEEVAANLSTRMLSDLDLPERIMSVLQSTGIGVSQLVLEVTETALVREQVKSLDVLTRLRMKGIRLAIDDFGTGYSTMQQLKRYPFTELKIDRSFVMRLSEDQESRAIVDTTIELGRRLGMQVVAEGVETLEALRYLKSQKCSMAQGYFIARPMPAKDFSEWLMKAPAQLTQY